MKYVAKKEISGTWFVNTRKINGKQKGRRFDNELEACEFALVESHYYYQAQMDLAWTKLTKISASNGVGELLLVGNDLHINQGDLMC